LFRKGQLNDMQDSFSASAGAIGRAVRLRRLNHGRKDAMAGQ
jgi:hypothetical protein